MAVEMEKAEDVGLELGVGRRARRSGELWRKWRLLGHERGEKEKRAGTIAVRSAAAVLIGFYH